MDATAAVQYAEYRRLADTHADRAQIEQSYEDDLICEQHAISLLSALMVGPALTSTGAGS